MSEWSRGGIREAIPRAGVEGGEVILACDGYDASDHTACRVMFGTLRGRLIGASPDRVIAAVPDCEIGVSAAELTIEGATTSFTTPFTLGTKIAENVHPVANPAIDRDDGSIYVTLSGKRGEKVPVSIYKISPDDTVSPFISDIVNPTGLAFNKEGTLYVTSRFDGTLYSISPFREVQTVASELGVATGVAIDRDGEIFVGDRSGTIFRINEIGESRPYATLDPSVSAYHLAFGPDGDLYVTGPTVSSYESVMRVDKMGNVSRFYTGLGRPQGLAFDADGNLYLAASLRGHRGIVRITPDGSQAEVVVSGSTLVGLAFDESGNMIVAGIQSVYRVPLGIRGYSSL
ncbi:MAG: SMP-30/gluconolactonase/LRE family protein [Acidobacteriota bacterium]|nr:MAG: SMP-30/gluconolactonase/LRE family protein [Acidobacteriota bacterium]